MPLARTLTRRIMSFGAGQPVLPMAAEPPVVPADKLSAAFESVRLGDQVALREFVSTLPPHTKLSSLRGPLGNTLLHRAYGFRQKAIARYLLDIDPDLISCFYECAEYHGENVLHQVIVQRDVEEVRFLAGRCRDLIYGRADGTSRRTTSTSYYGELPLSFAVCAYQPDIVEFLVVECGAFISAGDHRGNTAAHMCVLYDRLDVYMLLEQLWGKGYGRPPQHAAIPLSAIRNSEGQTPLVLAASLGKTEVFCKLWAGSRQHQWSWGDHSCFLYPLDHVDDAAQLAATARKTATQAALAKADSGAAEVDPKLRELLEPSALDVAFCADASYVVPPAPRFQPFAEARAVADDALVGPFPTALQAAAENDAHSLFVDPWVVALVEKKWQRFGKRCLMRKLLRTVLHLVLFASAAIMRTRLANHVRAADADGGGVAPALLFAAEAPRSSAFEPMPGLTDELSSAFSPAFDEQWLLRNPRRCSPGTQVMCAFTGVAEALVILAAGVALIGVVRRATRGGWRHAMHMGGTAPLEKLLPATTAVCMLGGYALDALYGSDAGASLLSIASITGWLYCGAMSMLASRETGPFIMMLIHMVCKDLVLFACLSASIIIGFTHAFFLLARDTGVYGFFGRMRILAVSMISQDPAVPEEHTVASAFAAAYAVIACVLMLNLLVALLSNTFSVYYQTANGHYHFAVASMTLEFEQSMSTHERQTLGKYWTEIKGRPFLAVEENRAKTDASLYEEYRAATKAALQRAVAMPDAGAVPRGAVKAV